MPYAKQPADRLAVPGMAPPESGHREAPRPWRSTLDGKPDHEAYLRMKD